MRTGGPVRDSLSMTYRYAQPEQPKYMSAFPCCSVALPHMIDVVEKARMAAIEESRVAGPGQGVVETEVRFGSCVDGNRFQTGISETALRDIEKQLDTAVDWWASVQDWVNVWVYHHPDPENPSQTLRTETVFTEGGDGTLPERNTIVKKTLFKKNMATETQVDGGKLTDIRVAVSREVPRKLEGTVRVLPTLVYLKKRKTYYLCSRGEEQPNFMYTLTKRWFGDNRSDCERNYKTTPPVCEVEIEICNPTYLQRTPPDYVAASLLFKSTDILQMIHSALVPTSYSIIPREI